MAQERNDIREQVGEYLQPQQVLDERTFRSWLEQRVPPHWAEVMIGNRGAIAQNYAPEPSPVAELKKADAVVLFSFDYGPRRPGCEEWPESFDSFYDPTIHEPGTCNEEIAAVGLRQVIEVSQKDVVVFAQDETAVALESMGVRVPYHHRAVPRRNAYLSTRGVAAYLAAAGLADPALQRIAVVAHGDHVRRCLGAVRAAIIHERTDREIVAHLPTLLVPEVGGIRFPKKGCQLWVSGAGQPGRGGPQDYRPHEISGRILGLWTGWLDVSDLTRDCFA